MAKSEVLARADADLERGDTRLAAQRLTSLLIADPQDLEIRARLADVYRRAGDVAEAGRWAFLTEDAEPHEIAAFAVKHPSATDRLRLLRLRGEDPRGLGPLAEPRYTALAAAADVSRAIQLAPPAPVPTTPAPVPTTPDLGWSCMDLLTAVAVFGPGVVVLCVIVYEIVTAVLPASPR